MVNRKAASALTIAALLACAIPAKSVASSLFVPVLGQSQPAPSFPVPDSVKKGTELTVVSSSDNMQSISEALGKGFQNDYSGKVDVTTTDADAAIQDVLNGNADLAAISRPLTAAEKEQGLIEVPVRREKIAIVVSQDSTFTQSITGSQFAQIFRGEITDWADVGGTAGPIKLVDRPDASETRQALSPYPVFATADFETGDNATQLSEDSTEALATELGADGIGYALVGQLEGQSDIKAIELHKTLPDDPRYPFSQPYSFVYAGGASPAVAAFLGYATGNPGQAALESADVSGYGVAPTADSGTTTAAADIDGTANADGAEAAGEAGSVDADGNPITLDADGNPITLDADGNPITLDADGNPITLGADGNPITLDADGNPITLDADGSVIADGTEVDGEGGLTAGRGRWWWLLLPLAGLGLLIWAAGKRGKEEETGYTANRGGTAAADDDKIRGSYRGSGLPNTGLGGVNTDGVSTAVGKVGSAGMGKVAAGGAVIAGGAAAVGGLAGKLKNKAGDTTMDLGSASGNISGTVKDNISGVKGQAQSGLGNLRSNVQGGVQGGIDGVKGGVDGIKGNVQGGLGNLRSNVQGGIQGGVDGIKGAGAAGLGAGAVGLGAAGAGLSGLRNKAQGGIDGVKGSVQGGIDGARTNLQGGIDGVKGNLQGGIDGAKGDSDSWLDRAKQRINEATDQVKDKASDIKDDITND